MTPIDSDEEERKYLQEELEREDIPLDCYEYMTQDPEKRFRDYWELVLDYEDVGDIPD